jgi:hypothetical protein
MKIRVYSRVTKNDDPMRKYFGEFGIIEEEKLEGG